MSAWVGFEKTTVTYDRESRFACQTKYPLAALVEFAFDAIVSFSFVPLRVASLVGFAVSALALVAIPIVIVLKISGLYVPGVASILIVMLLLGGIQLVHPADVGRPRAEQTAIDFRHAEQLGDDRDGERLGDRRDEVELGPFDAIDESLDDPRDGCAQGLDHPRRERLRDQASHPRVVGRLHIEDAGSDQTPERLVPRGLRLPPHLLVRRAVQVGTTHTPVPQQRVHVLIS